MVEALIRGAWLLVLDAACALDLGAGAAQHPALMALLLAYLNFWIGYGIATEIARAAGPAPGGDGR